MRTSYATELIFQPTPPARTETHKIPYPIMYDWISTHSAREDGDTNDVVVDSTETDFNPLRPRGRRLLTTFNYTKSIDISTHSAREDGDFIAIPIQFTVVISTHSAREDGDSNTTQKNKQFFITFPQSNHIILPQITANLPCTHPKPFSLCSFSGANPPVNSCLLLVRTKLFETSLPPAARSEYQRLFHFNPFTHPNMVHLCSVFISQVVKSKAVSLLINDICQYGF